jgi:TAG lipase/steryl ester hydrolase/phospholipase A2/LPA acyltransferase
MQLMEGGEHSTYPHVESIRTCTKISRTMEEILHRFEYGDLRPEGDKYHRPRASRRRPPPTRADREAMRETGSQRLDKAPVRVGGPSRKVVSKAVSKAATKPAAKSGTSRTKAKAKAKTKAKAKAVGGGRTAGNDADSSGKPVSDAA